MFNKSKLVIRSSLFNRNFAWSAIFLAFFIGYLLGHDSNVAQSFSKTVKTTGETIEIKAKETSEDGPGKSKSELLGLVAKNRRHLKQIIKQEFGTFSTYLINVDEFFRMEGISRERLQRRLVIKILAAQLNIANQGIQKPTFTWVSAGDSVAAGHGNLYSQSYTAVLEATVKESFDSIGIDFVAKNRGIGGYGSGPELAFCLESVYGSDIDMLSWDFGIADKGVIERIFLWANRVGIHPTKPIVMLMDDRNSGRWHELQKFENSGIGTILMDSRILEDNIMQGVADMNHPNSNDLPNALKYFRCNGSIEGNIKCKNAALNNKCNMENSDVCLNNKFQTREFCKDARFQTSWNPGMKYHHLKGRLMGLFVLEALNDALLMLDSLSTSHSSMNIGTNDYNVFQKLQTKERNDEFSFQRSAVLLGDWNNNKNIESMFEINASVLFRAHSICHTALLPSDIRYNGILSMNAQQYQNQFGFDVGQTMGNFELHDGILPLIYDPSERQECDLLNKDFKDFFLVPQSLEWLSVTVPNVKEINAYGKETTKRVGLILLCSRKCLGDCSAEMQNVEWDTKLKNHEIEMEVDKQRVTGMKEWEGCHFLEGRQGLKWGNGQNESFNINFKVNEKIAELFISSIIIF